jgi:hypothetical protein
MLMFIENRPAIPSLEGYHALLQSVYSKGLATIPYKSFWQ